ncbi:MAG TPA: DUF6457 domain-containing protein [Actinomycetota bacterium]|jgi:hypothetical protein|nr:DUF6457 domain-containing protein [Actinomycetota bacterium]
MDWPEQYGRALGDIIGADVSLSKEETGAVLRLAREVAHRNERKFAPLAAFVAGKFAALAAQRGMTSEESIERFLAAAEALLPPAEGAGATVSNSGPH